MLPRDQSADAQVDEVARSRQAHDRERGGDCRQQPGDAGGHEHRVDHATRGNPQGGRDTRRPTLGRAPRDHVQHVGTRREIQGQGRGEKHPEIAHALTGIAS